MARIAIFDTEYSTIRSLYYALEERGHEVITNVLPVKRHDQLVMSMVTDPATLVGKSLCPKVVDGQEVEVFPDIFVIDFLNLDGKKVMDILRQMSVTRKTPVIAMSHHGSKITREHLIRTYGTHVVSKPFHVLDVVQRIEAFLGINC